MSRDLTPEQRLAVQLLNVTAAGTDLRRFKGDDTVRDLFWNVRDLRNRVASWRLGIYPDEFWRREGRFEWAVERCKRRLGLSDSSWEYEGERLAEHTLEADLRLILEHLEEIR